MTHLQRVSGILKKPFGTDYYYDPVNIWDMGTVANFIQVFGRNPLLWLWPFVDKNQKLLEGSMMPEWPRVSDTEKQFIKADTLPMLEFSTHIFEQYRNSLKHNMFKSM